jgi:hypothetical protein
VIQYFPGRRQDGLRLRQQFLPCTRHGHPTGSPFKQRHANFFFQRLDLCSHGGLGQMQQFGGLGQMPLLGHGDKGPQLIDFHVRPVLCL